MDLEAAAVAATAQTLEQPRQPQKGEVVFILNSMGGGSIRLEPMQSTVTVRELALQVRAALSIPISVQNLIWGSQLLSDPSKQLVDLFGAEATEVNLTVVRRPFTVAERAELFKQLVRAAAGGHTRIFRELLREGAQIDFDPDTEVQDTSISLSHWQEDEQDSENAAASPAAGSQGKSQGAFSRQKSRAKSEEEEEAEGGVPVQEDPESSEDSEDPEADFVDRGTRSAGTGRNWPMDMTPLLMAIVAGDEDLAKDLRALGAKEPDLKPKHQRLPDAFRARDFADVVRHIAGGADVNTRLYRGFGVQDTEEGRPLHACAAMSHMPGSLEVAQLLLRKRADVSIGDAEGDNALAHARYFGEQFQRRGLDSSGARELYRLLEGHGAKLEGPFYRRFGR